MLIKRRNKFIPCFLVCLPLLYGGLSSCSNREKFEQNSQKHFQIEMIPSIVGVAALGQLSPSGEVRELASPITQFGTFPRVVKVLIEEGDYVKKGDILVVFENRKRLEADLQKKEKLLSTNEEEIALKKEQIKRYELASEKNAYSVVSLLQRKDELLKLEKQKINNLSEKINIEIDLFNSQLRSPIDGFILSIKTRVGERSSGEGILEIGASQEMEALIEVYESDIDRVFVDQEVKLTSENGGFREELQGRVVRISPKVKQRKVLSTDPKGDADARVIEVLVELDQDSINLVEKFAGMKVIARFLPR